MMPLSVSLVQAAAIASRSVCSRIDDCFNGIRIKLAANLAAVEKLRHAKAEAEPRRTKQASPGVPGEAYSTLKVASLINQLH